MGNCLSPILSNLYMEYFEKELLSSVANFEYTLFRYVDDIFAVITNSIEIPTFLTQFNKLSETINFKVEIETENE